MPKAARKGKARERRNCVARPLSSATAIPVKVRQTVHKIDDDNIGLEKSGEFAH
jgi:L-serine deaminase